MIELALPAGNLENALVAFKNGADAVYFGMKMFSARKGAVNFSLEDLRKIRAFSKENNKKIYVTVNTLVDDSSLPDAYKLLEDIARYNPDGIIIQDLGLVELVRKEFPSLPLHGSTQLAVHNISGVREMQDLGFERVVLSRELSLKEIEKIRSSCPDIELKVFIHGAMCYGFSGLCMASRHKTGRSANEGACAQVCRTWFHDKESGRAFYPFSLKDLEIAENIIALDEMGIDSAKVEGRLKGNEYVAQTARLYRSILDGKRNLENNQHFTFARARGTGFLNYNGPGHEILTTGDYTGHLGQKVAFVKGQEGRRVSLELLDSIKSRDGLMYLKRNKEGLLESVRFSANLLMEDIIVLPDFDKLEKGEAIYKVSDSSLNEKKIKDNLIPVKELLKAKIVVEKDKLVVKSTVLEKIYPVEVESSEKDRGRSELERIFSQSGDSNYQLSPIEIINETGYGNFFIRSSTLKEIRRDYLKQLDDLPKTERNYEIRPFQEGKSFLLPERALLSDRYTPWCLEGKVINGIRYITLPPVIYEEEGFYEKLEHSLSYITEPVLIGLNNIGQLRFAKTHKDYKYFADIYLYLSNRESARLVKEELASTLVGGYLWMEREDFIAPWPFEPTIVRNFTSPSFISRACYRHDGLGLDCLNCKREHVFIAEQNGEEYEVYVKDCQSVITPMKRK